MSRLYAVGLAKRLGVMDEKLIKAIEAAALLHDMGKLAVPEHILNKPGKLTDSEFEKMKLHASVGADILSAIDFPYPVVPIVRHHHEQWDGGGYPTGLSGTDIPIGARILSVVDCFDALTSDRPYRPRLTDDEALDILIERRGSLYDPLIVDTFVRVHADIRDEIPVSRLPRQTLNEITGSMQPPSTSQPATKLEDIATSAHELLTLYEVAGALAGQASVNDTADVITNHLRRLVPFTQSVLYLYDGSKDELEAKHAVGDASTALKGLRIPMGQRISGWVAVNRKTALNSDPALDLEDIARSLNPRLRSCLSTPLTHGNELVGVISLYSNTADAFDDDDRRVVEIVAQHIGYTFKCAVDFDAASKRDSLTGLPNLQQLERVMEAITSDGLGVGSQTALVFIDVIGFRELNSIHGRQAGDEVLKHVVKYSRTALRVADILFRYGGDEFVALLNRTDLSVALPLAETLRHNIVEHKLMLRDGTVVEVRTDVVCVCSPSDGTSLRELVNCARARLGYQQSQFETRVH